MLKIAAVLGTRPEAVKLAPVLEALRRRADKFNVSAIATGQHGEVLANTIDALAIGVDHRLDVLTPGQPMWRLHSRLTSEIGQVLEQTEPDLVVVQGDTLTALSGALTAALLKIPVAHVEAGLRTGSTASPFPEEINRLAIARVTRLHFAPTGTAAGNLVREGIDPAHIVVTGNTVADSLARTIGKSGHDPAVRDDNRLRILVTTHRRENWNEQIDHICAAVRDLVGDLPESEVRFILPTAPEIRARIRGALAGLERVHLEAALAYPRFLDALALSDLVLTDSGGVQEEATMLGIPTVVMRDRTDRPESLRMPFVTLAPPTRGSIAGAARGLLGRIDRHHPHATTLFGDGRASERIASAIANWHAGHETLLPPGEEFQG